MTINIFVTRAVKVGGGIERSSQQCIFTSLHGMQTRYSDEKAVNGLSVKRVNCDKTEKKICPDFYTIRKNI